MSDPRAASPTLVPDMSSPPRLVPDAAGSAGSRSSEPTARSATGGASPQVLAWDLPTRLFKWSLVACFVAAWATNRYALERPYLHVWNGIAVLVLLVFRLLWGLFGGSTARFSAFVTSPVAALLFLRRQLGGRAASYLGHSPAAGQVIVALLVLLAVQACLGLFSSDPDRLVVEGPLAAAVGDAAVRRLSHFHRLGFQILLALVLLHVAANLAYALLTRSGYLKAMVTGRKPARPYCDFREARPGSLPTAAACFAASLLLVFGIIRLLGGSFGL